MSMDAPEPSGADDVEARLRAAYARMLGRAGERLATAAVDGVEPDLGPPAPV